MMRDALSGLIGRPVVELACWLYGRIRALAYAKVEGRHYQYKRNPIDVTGGLPGERWLLLSDVRRSLPGLPALPVLSRWMPDRIDTADGPRQARIEARALAGAIERAADPATRRFLLWLQREVIYPAERAAARTTRRV